MNKESRNAFTVIGAVLVALLAIGLIFSGSPEDAVVSEAPVAHGEAEEGAEGEAVSEAPADAAGEPAQEEASPAAGEAEPEVPAEVTALPPEEPAEAEAAEAASEEAATEEATAPEAAASGEAEVAEGAAPSEEAVEEAHEEVALAGDPEAGERVFRQCQACHQVGEGAENRVGPQLTGIVGRPIASVEEFTYSDSLAALGQEGREWTPEELSGFLANPREYVPGTAMAYAGVRSEDDLQNLIAYLASVE